MPARDEFVNQIGADETGSARDKTFHSLQKNRFNSGAMPRQIP